MAQLRLRPYQREAVDAVKRDWLKYDSVVVVVATGGGKTQVYLSTLDEVLTDGKRGLVLAHRQELVSQPLERIVDFFPAWDERTGIVMADRNECSHQLTLATVQTLANPKRLAELLAYGPIDFVVTDEAHHCHLPGTKVLTTQGYRSIETLQVGAVVLGWDGTIFAPHRIDNTFSYWYDGPIHEITTEDGATVRVTPNHKLYSGGRLVYAKDIRAGESLSVPALRRIAGHGVRPDAAHEVAAPGDEALSEVLCDDASGRPAAASGIASSRASSLSPLWASDEQESARGAYQQRSRRELDEEPGEPSASDGTARTERGVPSAPVGSDEGQEPNDVGLGTGTDGGLDQGQNREGRSEGVRGEALRERRCSDAGRDALDGGLPECGLSACGCSRRRREALSLQAGPCVAGQEDRAGCRWNVAPETVAEGCRCAQTRTADSYRVGVAEATEPGRTVRESRVTAVRVRNYSGLVHDIEVGDVHNYVANGILSSNSTASTYLGIYEALRKANPQLLHLGVTATPLRTDGDGLKRVFQKISYKAGIKELIKLGHLVPFKALAVQTSVSLQSIRTTDGDFVQSQLANVWECENVWDLVVESHLRWADGRPAMAFTVSVEGAHRLAEKFSDAGIPAEAADGTTSREDRAAIVGRFKSGETKVLCNCALWTEGLDLPKIAAIHMCRPTKSDLVYVQAMGRGLRQYPGKEDCLVLDYAPEDARNIVMAGDLLGKPRAQKKVEEQAEKAGVVIAGFSFTGDGTGIDGDPDELVTRPLNYLSTSPYAWYFHDGISTLGLGEQEGVSRTLVIVPPGFGKPYRLVIVERAKGTWQTDVRVLNRGEFDDLADQGAEYAEEHGAPVLVSRDRPWQRQPLTDPQLHQLRRLLPGANGELSKLSRGEAARLLTHAYARQAIERAGWRPDPAAKAS